MMKKLGKILLIGISLFAIAVTALNYVGVFLDEEPLDFKGLLPVAEVDDKDNGFNVLSDFLAEDQSEISDELDQLIHSAWNESRSSAVLAKHQDKLNLIEQVLAKPSFKSPSLDFEEGFPSFTRYGDLIDLVILKSQSEVEVRNYVGAVDQIKIAINFSQTIKTDQSATFVTYFTGIAYQNRVLNWVHRFISNYALPEEQLIQLANILEIVPDYESDQFNMVFSGESDYMETFPEDMRNPKFISRVVALFDSDIDSAAFGWWNIWGKNSVVNLLSIPSYHYFYQRQRVHNNYYRHLLYLQKETSEGYCLEIDYQNRQALEKGIWASFGMNALGGIYYENWKDHISRRCFSDFYIQAIKTNLALKRHSLANNQSAQTLTQLVPDYLSSVPIDAFTGVPILYNRRAQTLYSRGLNSVDGGGDIANFISRCFQDIECKESPTVSVTVGPNHRIREPEN